VRFRDVQHQDRALSILRRALRSGRVHHAFLFHGPAGVGKELAGRALAARLLCLAAGEDDFEACGACDSCRLLVRGNHPDFHFVDRTLNKVHPDRTIRASKGLFLVVDVIRHFLIDPSTRSPAVSPRRVFLVRDAERMNEQAQNALLKTLEEPPGAACLILVTEAASRLLPTIRSRCQAVAFDLLPPAFVEHALVERWNVPAAEARALARVLEGRLGPAVAWHRAGWFEALRGVADAVSPAGREDVEAFGKRLIEIATEFGQRSHAAADVAADDDADAETLAAEDEGADAESDAEGVAARGKSGGKALETDALRTALRAVLALGAAVYRDALLEQNGQRGLRALPADLRAVQAIAGDGGLAAEDAVWAFAQCEGMLERNVAPALCCEWLGAALNGAAPIDVG